MQWAGEQFGHRGVLDHFRGVHHGHVVGHFGDDAQVVRDHQDRHAHLGLQLAQQVENLGLDGHVEGGGRLVGNQQLGRQESAMAIITRCRMPPDN